MEQGEQQDYTGQQEQIDHQTDLKPSKNPRHTELRKGGTGHVDMSAIVSGTALSIPTQEIGNDPLKKTNEPRSQPDTDKRKE
ncbi:Hypothetical predicted protein, partial [Paramuricea clavata]